ncbi:HigB toxin protein [hydrothermal vent metagenome]|uniref:HigB toxin protein n=1 Tax=hydrothermal vent metagenome TaxID=652676 RepID=A0A1W1EJ06_9ZZZZ
MKYRLKQTDSFKKTSRKFFKKHRNLINKFKLVTFKLNNNPFDVSLKTHKLKGHLSNKYACSLNYEYRIILTIEIIDKEIYLIDIGTHDEVY